MKTTLTVCWFFVTVLICYCSGQCQEKGTGTCKYQVSHSVSVQASYKSTVVTEVFYKACGVFNWGRCAAYRQTYRTSYRKAYRVGYRQAYRCCPGWQEDGSECKAICSSSCLNGGLCCSPNTCQCANGYHGAQCHIPICSPSCRHGGACVGPNVCACKQGFNGKYCQTSSGICPNNITTPNTPGQAGAIVVWNLVNLEKDVRVTSIYAPGDFFKIGSYVVTYRFESDSLHSSCSFTVTVQDTEPPKLYCPNEAQYYTETDTTTTTVQLDPPIVIDNSGHVANVVFFTSRNGKSYQEINGHAELPIGQTRVAIDAFDSSRNKASCKYVVTVTARCSKETVTKQNRELSWEPTIAGAITESLQRCPLSTAGRNRGLAARNCTLDDNIGAIWGEVVEYDCGHSMEFDETNLSQIRVTFYNIKEVVDALKNISARAKETEAKLDMVSVLQVMSNVVFIPSSASYVAETIASVVDNIIANSYVSKTKDRSMANITSEITKLFMQQIVQTIQHNDDLSFNGENLALKAMTVGQGDGTNGFGITLLMKDTSIKELTKVNLGKQSLFTTTTTTTKDMLRNDSFTSIWLPGTLFSFQNHTKVTFIMFNGSSLFKSMGHNSEMTYQVICPIVSTTVIGQEAKNLSQPVILQMFCGKDYEYGHMWNKTFCVFWDYNQHDGIGDWSKDGCELVGTTSGWITCHCNHLSTFAVVMEVPIKVYHTPLFVTVISKTGSALSILMLSVVLLALLSRQVQLTRLRKIEFHISLSALFLYFLIVIGVDIPGWTNGDIGCPIVGALIHYFILTTISWMAFEARCIYNTAFTRDSEDESMSDLRYFVLASIFSWGLPLVVVGIPFALARDEYDNQNMCFLGSGYVQLFGLFLPAGILLQHNLVALILTTLRLFTPSIKQCRQLDLPSIKAHLQDAFLITLALEITWISRILLETSILEDPTSLQIICSTFGAFTGVLVGFLFCVHQRDIRHLIIEKWCQKLCTKKPIPPNRSSSRNVQCESSNPDTNLGGHPSYYPSYLIPIGQGEPCADIVTSSSNKTSRETSMVQDSYSYATCENVYEDYEKLEDANTTDATQSMSGTILAKKGSTICYEVGDVEGSKLALGVLKSRNGTAKAPSVDDNSKCNAICDASVALSYRPDDSDDNMHDDAVGDDDKIYAAEDDDYEPVENPPSSKQKGIAGYWTEVARANADAENDHYSYAECNSRDESGTDDDMGYEPIEPPSNAKTETRSRLADNCADVVGDEQDTHSYESFDNDDDNDDYTDEYDYEHIAIE